jgi:hypothetical protein
MDLKLEIETIERRLALGGVPMADFFRNTSINRSTWTRWRAGSTVPRLDNWMGAVLVAGEMLGANASHNSSPDSTAAARVAASSQETG